MLRACRIRVFRRFFQPNQPGLDEQGLPIKQKLPQEEDFYRILD